jgi:MFS family permease
MINRPRPIRVQNDLVAVSQALNLFRFASALVGVFVPLIVLKAGGSVTTMALYLFSYALAKLALNFPIMKLIAKHGAHYALGAGFAFGALELICIWLYSTHAALPLLLAGAVCMAASNAFCWNAQHYFISRVVQPETQSSSLASIEIVGQLGGLAAPLIGAIVGSTLGTGALLALAVLCVLFTAWPLRRMGRQLRAGQELQVSYRLSGAPARDLFANFCFNLETTISVMLWPVYLAVALGTYRQIGLVATIAGLASIAAVWVAGHRGDRGSDRAVLREGVAASAIIDVLRIFAVTPLTITAVGAGYRAALAYLQNPWTSTYYYHAKQHGPQYIMSMEIACDLAYACLWGLLLLLLGLGVGQTLFFNLAFIIAAAAALGCLAITPRQRAS